MTEKIPTLKPDNFKKLLMADIDHFQLDKPNFNDFYIHDLSKDSYTLKLPLPPRRKTVNDFILITSGTMTKSSGIDTYKVTQNSIFLLPVGQITTTTSISKELKGFYCHFSNNFLTETKSQLDILSQFPFLEWLNNPIVFFDNADKENLTSLLKRIESLGWRDDFLKIWFGDFLIGCCLSIPTGFTVVPLIKKWVDSMTEK